MTQYLKHPPILLIFEWECANLLSRGQTYQLEEAEGKRLENLLRAGRVTDETRIQDSDLIEFMVGERLVSLQDAPVDSTFTVKDFRKVKNHRGWLRLRALCSGFILFTCIVDLLVLPGSVDGYIKVQSSYPWSGMVLLLPVLLHESVHYFTGKAFGLDGKPGLGLRGWIFLVATVTFPSLYELPKHLRWLPILAPMVLDCVIFLALLPFREIPLVAFFHLFYSGAIFWQFLIFLRTDIYIFLATMFNQPNLNQLVWRRNSTASSGEILSVSEKKAKRLYLALFVFSTLIMARIISISL